MVFYYLKYFFTAKDKVVGWIERESPQANFTSKFLSFTYDRTNLFSNSIQIKFNLSDNIARHAKSAKRTPRPAPRPAPARRNNTVRQTTFQWNVVP